MLIFAQKGTITGKVINSETQAALAKATVFLTETSYGTSTNDDGTFSIKGLKPGTYLVVVTMLGFEEFVQSVTVDEDAISIKISLKPSVITLPEVNIQNPKDWARNYKLFVRRFIGTSKYGRSCKILNSEVLNFSYNKKEGLLSTTSNGFIKMENRALGYMVKILLTKSALAEKYGSWHAQFFYEELPGTPSEIKKWKANRIELLRNPGTSLFVSERLPSNFRNSTILFQKNKE
jgi:hypothetical protein